MYKIKGKDNKNIVDIHVWKEEQIRIKQFDQYHTVSSNEEYFLKIVWYSFTPLALIQLLNLFSTIRPALHLHVAAMLL